MLLEQACVCLFGATVLASGRVLVRASPACASPASTGSRMRRNFVLGFAAASLTRCVALAMDLALRERALPFITDHLSKSQVLWVGDLLGLLPSAVFLSAFSIVILFWAQLYYTTAIVPMPLLDCTFVCINISVYLVLGAVALCTFLLQAYEQFWLYTTCVIGALDVVVAGALLYYGLLVVSELSEASKHSLPGRRLGFRVGLLSVFCSVMLLARGASYIAWDVLQRRPPASLDVALSLVGEWLPMVVALITLNPMQRGGSKIALDTLDDSSESEAPLLQDEQPEPLQKGLCGAPSSSWKQLYPQPTTY